MVGMAVGLMLKMTRKLRNKFRPLDLYHDPGVACAFILGRKIRDLRNHFTCDAVSGTFPMGVFAAQLNARLGVDIVVKFNM